ncbi:Hpt domain-containing protein [Jannaschia sp.]|nr:Hpt domain-containing protein [Jannaschia sp.]
MRDKMLDLLARHHAQFAQQAAEIDGAIQGFPDAPEDARRDLHRAAHSLKGSCGSMGFQAMSKAAERLELVLKGAVSSGATAANLSQLAALSQGLMDVATETRLEDSTLYQRFI